MTELALREIEREMNQLWENWVKPWFEDWFELDWEENEENFPAVDILKARDHYRMLVELPGLSEKDFSLEVDNGVLSIKGTRPEPDLKDAQWIRRERARGEFLRRFQLPEEVDSEKIEARFKDGILEIHLPIRQSSKPKEIRIEVH